MGKSILDIDLFSIYSIWELLGLFVGVPFALFGLYQFLKMEFKMYATVNIITILSVASAVLLVNEVRLRHFLETSDADQMVTQADNLWEVSKIRESYERLENALEVASYQRDEDALIDGYRRITDRYFSQEDYRRPVRLSQLEMEYLIRTRDRLIEYNKNIFADDASYHQNIDFDAFEGSSEEYERHFYQNLHALTRERNNRFRDQLFYSSVPMTGTIKEDMDATREAYLRAVNIITLAMQVEDNIIPSSLLGKYFHAMATLEENLGNDAQAYAYTEKAKYYWDDFRPKIQSGRLALKLRDDEALHLIVEDIVNSYAEGQNRAENAIFVLEAAALEFSAGYLHRSRAVYNTLKGLLAEDLQGFDVALSRVNQDLGSTQQSKAYLYPFLEDVRDIRDRMNHVDDRLGKINITFSDLSAEKEQESRIVELRGRMDLAVDYMHEAVKHAEDAGHKVFLFKHHVRLATLYNKLGHYEDARDHALKARAVHNGDNFVLVRKKPENDLAKHYPQLLHAQLGLGDLEGAQETLATLKMLGESRVYEIREPNHEMYEYLKGKVFYHVKTGEMLRAQLYFDDAINFLLNYTAERGIPLKADMYADHMFARNKYERQMIDLILIGERLFKKGDVPDFLITKTQLH